MLNCLVTGCAGFIGRSLAARLLEQGHRVRGLDDLSTGRRENLAGLEAMEFLEGDLTRAETALEACRGAELVFHEAALPSVARSVENPGETNRRNVTGTLVLLEAARAAGVRRVVYAGSSSAYGNSETLPKHERMPPAPLSPYAVSKLAGEYYLQSFTSVYGLETVTLRYFNVFGPYQDPNSFYSGVLARFSLAMLQGQAPTIFGDGEQSRDFTYIDNVVSANLGAALAPAGRVNGRVFNVATGTRISLNRTVEMLRGITGYRGEVKYGPERRGDVRHSLADISAAAEAFGYRPEVDFGQGLARTVNWYRERALA